MAIFSIGNRKLPKSIAIFNLPRLITCPNRTPLCEQICYAKKAERGCFPKCLPQRMRNLFLSHKFDFVDVIIGELNQIPQNKVRIHESGDFYSQKYLDNWIKIINNFPEKVFVAYSKSKLDFSKKPDNFILFFSVDRTTKGEDRQWYIDNPYKDAIAEINNEEVNCPGSCKRFNCNRCYNKNSVMNTYFVQH